MKCKTTLAFAVGAFASGYIVKRIWKTHYGIEKARGDGEQRLKNLYFNWLKLRQNEVLISQRLQNMGIKSVAIFGLDSPGRMLIDELENSDIRVSYAIESDNPSAVHKSLEVLRLNDDPLLEVDAVIICAFSDIDKIAAELQAKISAKIITLEELIV